IRSAPPTFPFPIVRCPSLVGDRVLPLAEVEKRHILRVLDRVGGNQTVAAKLLGIGRNTLARKLKRYGM
ncbi:MAG: helix-turn-helix domain-containing protein, partial [Polyangiaceae bacterium]